MKRVFVAVHGRLIGEDGASLVEYALLVALIAVVAIVAITSVGREVNSTFEDIASNL